MQRFLSREEAEEVTWLELLYDLVFVAILIQLGNMLSHDLTFATALEFALLLGLLWWAWLGTSTLYCRDLQSDSVKRLLMFAQLFALGTLGIVVADTFADKGASFCVLYGAVRALVGLLYLWVARVQGSKGAWQFGVGFIAAAGVWVVSAFLSPPYRYALWAVAVAIDVWVIFFWGLARINAEMPLNLERLSERMGQFVLIMIGESFIKTIGSDLTETGITFTSVVFGGMGFIITASLWRTYFGDTAQMRLSDRDVPYWIMLHLPLVAGIAATGVALLEVVTLTFGAEFNLAYRTLLGGALGLYFLTLALIDVSAGQEVKRLRVLSHGGAVVALVVLLLFGTALSPFWEVLIITLICLSQVVVEVVLKEQGPTSVRVTKLEA